MKCLQEHKRLLPSKKTGTATIKGGKKSYRGDAGSRQRISLIRSISSVVGFISTLQHRQEKDEWKRRQAAFSGMNQKLPGWGEKEATAKSN
jgi:hypothetical protein